MIIEYHGGKLSASSDSKVGGASFEFVLPIGSIAKDTARRDETDI
jgi:hypothetical protein